MRARHYDPTTGRFLQPDPEGIASTQRYAFAEHNPYIYNDPTGRSSRGIGSLDRGVPSWAFEGRPNELAGWDVATAAFGDGGRGLSGLVQHDAAVRGRWADEAWDDGRYASWAANSTMAMFNEYVGGEVAYSLENPGQTIALAAVGGLAFRTAARATGAVVRGVTGGSGRQVFRQGTFADDTIDWGGNYVKGKQWAGDNPLTTPNFSKRYGLPAENTQPDWVVGGRIRGDYSVRPAPGSHNNPLNTGGAPEYLPRDLDDVILDFFHMPD